MGSNWSKLHKYLEKGDEAKVLEIYNKSNDIKRRLNANSVVNDITLDTYMHLGAKHGMCQFLKLLLYENNGNPNKINRKKQTVLHKVCEGSNDSIQYECMQILLQWHDNKKRSSNSLSIQNQQENNSTNRNLNQNLIDINVNAKDEIENTPLHYASMRNLPTCVQTLVAHGAYLFVENAQHSTPCDLAEKYSQKDIALYLESKMIFSKDDEEKENLEEELEMEVIEEKQNYGLRIQDLQEEKDKLLVETADMLHVNIFTAEILLKKHAWSKQNLLNAWIEDAKKCCEKCGICFEAIESNKTISQTDNKNLQVKSNNQNNQDSLKSVVIARKLSGRYLTKKKDSSVSIRSINNQESKLEIDTNVKNVNDVCGICFLSEHENEIENSTFLKQILCGHKFCKICWQQYLTMKIEEGNVGDIVCPQVDCFAIIPHDVVESLVNKETAQKYLHFDLKAFVDSNPTIKWCPYPECGMAVRNPRLFYAQDSNNLLNDSDQMKNASLTTSLSSSSNKDYSRSVDCGNGHYFCWDCLQEGHEPASCKNWKEWFEKILEIKPEEMCNTNEKEELSANYLWLVTNSKKCPNSNCNAPIQKNEGCNHVKCYRCKFDFCWICLEPWKKHSSATGGYFQCNRYEVSSKILQKEKVTVHQAEEQHIKAVELNKFVHYYTRFKNHELSYKIEEPLLAMAKTKFEILTNANNQNNLSIQTNSNQNLQIEQVIKQSDQSQQIENETSRKSSKQFAKKLSHSLEKGVSRIFHNNLDQKSNNLQEENTFNLNTDEIIKYENSNEINENNFLLQETTNIKSKEEEQNNETHLFIEEAIRELLKSRRILRCSYVYGYYLDTFGHKKFIFEFIQTEFEECTENLSQIIARPHLKTPKHKIIRLTNLLKRKRIEFLDTITRGLNNFNDTPPTLKKYSRQRWKYLLKDNIQNDDEFRNAIALSLKELNPKNPWIVDRKGRHTNLLALLNDWPELEHDLDSILVPSKEKNGLCAKWDCGNVRAVNTLSGSLCNYCSIKCMRADHNAYLEQKRTLNNSSSELNLSSSLSKQSKNILTDSNKATTSKALESPIITNKRKSSGFSTIQSETNEPIQFEDDDFFDMGFRNEITNKTNSFVFDLADADLMSAIQLSKLDHDLLELKKKKQNENNEINKFESDTQLAIELSLNKNKMDDSNKNITTINLPYEPFFISANEKDISILIKNIENILYEENNCTTDSQNGQSALLNQNSSQSNSIQNDYKTSKTFNFKIKAKN